MIKFYGSSDDLLEIDGDIYEEFYVPDDKPFYVALSDGTLLRIHYDEDAIWRIHLSSEGKDSVYQKIEGSVEKDTPDILIIEKHEPIKWVIVNGEKYPESQMRK
jgi:hypothetical protein